MAARRSLAAVLILLAAASFAHAQVVTDVPPPTKEEARKGLAAGLSFGGGSVSVKVTNQTRVPFLHSETSGAVDGEVWVAMYFTSRAALVGDIDFGSAAKGGRGPAVLGVGAQYWVRPRIWFKLGVGYASMDATGPDLFPAEKTGPAFSVAGGGSLAEWRQASVDLLIRFVTSDMEDVRAKSVTTQIGFAFWK